MEATEMETVSFNLNFKIHFTAKQIFFYFIKYDFVVLILIFDPPSKNIKTSFAFPNTWNLPFQPTNCFDKTGTIFLIQFQPQDEDERRPPPPIFVLPSGSEAGESDQFLPAQQTTDQAVPMDQVSNSIFVFI